MLAGELRVAAEPRIAQCVSTEHERLVADLEDRAAGTPRHDLENEREACPRLCSPCVALVVRAVGQVGAELSRRSLGLSSEPSACRGPPTRRIMRSMPQPSSVPEVIITIIAGPARGRTMKLDGTLSIGREDTDLTVADDQLSRRHVELRLAPGVGVVVEDLGSTNGTFVDGRRITWCGDSAGWRKDRDRRNDARDCACERSLRRRSPRSPATKRNEILIRAAILLVGGIISLLLIVAQTSAEHSHPHTPFLASCTRRSSCPTRRSSCSQVDFIGGPATTGGATIDQVYLVPPGVAPLERHRYSCHRLGRNPIRRRDVVPT